MKPLATEVSAQRIASGWPQWWTQRDWMARLLLPLACVFSFVAGLRRLLYAKGLKPTWHAPVPVIVIGNLTVGGTGKTPLVLAIAQQLRASGWHPGIVSRGYGRKGSTATPLEVDPDADPVTTGDEPLLLRRLADCPVWIGHRRPAAAQALLRSHPEVDVLLSDDGLQHLALGRDVELVVTDLRGPGNGWLLPAGPLREPWTRRRDATLGPPASLTGTSSSVDAEAPRFALQRELGMVRQVETSQQLSLQDFLAQHAGQALAAAAGIGHPEQFFGMLRQAGAHLVATLALPDHHSFDADPFAPILADIVLITEKDALKCRGPTTRLDRLWAVGLQLEADPAFFPWLLAQLNARSQRHHGLPPA